jgi:DinB family protein
MLMPTLVLAALLSNQVPPPEFKASSNPVSDAVRQVLVQQSKNLIDAAELMPADKYGYHPTDAQMTFGKLVAHVVQTNVAICAGAGGGNPDTAVFKLTGTEPKDALVGAIKQSFTSCTEALAKVTDAQLGEEVSMMGRRTGMSRASAIITIANDWADHYSTAASYLRLNGILPPSAQPKK